MLTKTKHWAKDNRGCEFPVEIMTTWRWSDLPPNTKHNEPVERIYYCEWFDIKADSLAELKAKMDEIG
jgi:hypothetical protein